MKKTILVKFIIIFLLIKLSSQDYFNYKMELVKIFPAGKGNGELQNDMHAPFDTGPSAIAFNNDGDFYVSDILNTRLVKFNQFFEYIEAYDNCFSSSARHLFIDENSNFLTYYFGNGFAVDDKDGNKKFIINFSNSHYKYKLDPTPTYIYYDNIVFTYLKNGSLISIPEPGLDTKENINKILDKEKTIKYLEKKNNELYKSIFENKNQIVNNRIIINDDIITNNFQTFYNYKKEKKSLKVIIKNI